jgi:hypothetical protein
LSREEGAVPQRKSALLNVERALWLSVGIIVATVASFVFRTSYDGSSRRFDANSANPSASVVIASASPSRASTDAPGIRQSTATVPKRDAASVEELPLVEAEGAATRVVRTARGAARVSSTGNATEQGTRGALASPPEVQLASSKKETAVVSGTFDTGQARRVLANAAVRAQGCADGALSGSVLVTFAPTGLVQSASLASVAGEGVRQGCVLRAFQEARVSPFSGAAVSVKKSF